MMCTVHHPQKNYLQHWENLKISCSALVLPLHLNLLDALLYFKIKQFHLGIQFFVFLQIKTVQIFRIKVIFSAALSRSSFITDKTIITYKANEI